MTKSGTFERMRSEETSVAGYIKSLPPERAAVIKEIRALINKNLPAGYEEVMRWGMITWEVPLKRYPDTYNGEPLMYAALAAQKNNFSLYLMGPYHNYSVTKFISHFEAAQER